MNKTLIHQNFIDFHRMLLQSINLPQLPTHRFTSFWFQLMKNKVAMIKTMLDFMFSFYFAFIHHKAHQKTVKFLFFNPQSGSFQRSLFLWVFIFCQKLKNSINRDIYRRLLYAVMTWNKWEMFFWFEHRNFWCLLNWNTRQKHWNEIIMFSRNFCGLRLFAISVASRQCAGV